MGEGKILIGVCLSVIVSLCYCFFISSKIPKGKYRFISILPIFYLFTILRLYLYVVSTTVITTFLISWLANFKLLLYSIDQGPLSCGPPKKSLLRFITIAALPIKIKQNNNNHHNQDPKSSHTTKSKKKIHPNLATKTILFAILVIILRRCRESAGNHLHPEIVLVLYSLYCVLLYLMIDVLVASLSTIVRAMVGLELEPPSNEPYLSTSLQDFWGKRWNLMATNILRQTVYIPVKSATTGLLGKDRASLLAVFATFVVSGLMHELILYHLTWAAPTWEMASYFLLQGVCIVVEVVMKRAMAKRWGLMSYVSGPLAVGFPVITSFWLFFPPVLTNGLDMKVIDEVMMILEYIKSRLQLLM